MQKIMRLYFLLISTRSYKSFHFKFSLAYYSYEQLEKMT